MQFALKMLTLLAVIFVPLSMGAPAAAAAGHEVMAGAAMEHCPKPVPSHEGKPGIANCTMACAAALPAIEPGTGEAPLIVCTPVRPSVGLRLHGVHPETATPPPKRS